MKQKLNKVKSDFPIGKIRKAVMATVLAVFLMSLCTGCKSIGEKVAGELGSYVEDKLNDLAGQAGSVTGANEGNEGTGTTSIADAIAQARNEYDGNGTPDAGANTQTTPDVKEMSAEDRVEYLWPGSMKVSKEGSIESEAAEIIDASIEKALIACAERRISSHSTEAVYTSKKAEPFAKYEYLLDEMPDARKDLYLTSLKLAKNYEEYEVLEKEYGKDLVVDALSVSEAYCYYDPLINCYSTLDFKGNDVYLLYFDPENDANFPVAAEGEEFEEIKHKMEVLECVLDRIVKRMPKDLSTYEKYYYLAAVISARTTYDVKQECRNRTTAYGCLIGGCCICEGYASSYSLLCERAGLFCKLQHGKAEGTGHIWNLVNLEGKTYNVDVTWCDGYELSDYRWFFEFCTTQDECEASGHSLIAGDVATATEELRHD